MSLQETCLSGQLIWKNLNIFRDARCFGPMLQRLAAAL
jgi:hypothetical protein